MKLTVELRHLHLTTVPILPYLPLFCVPKPQQPLTGTHVHTHSLSILSLSVISTYPQHTFTRQITFNMETIRVDHNYYSRKAIRSLDIVVVGAGIAGLTAGLAFARTGHRVTVLESVPNLCEVGAGIQIAPNASRILHGLGVLGEVMEHASVLTNVSIRYVELRSL